MYDRGLGVERSKIKMLAWLMFGMKYGIRDDDADVREELGDMREFYSLVMTPTDKVAAKKLVKQMVALVAGTKGTTRRKSASSRPKSPPRSVGGGTDMAARMARQEGVVNATHDAVIARALRIMEGRLQYRDVALNSPQAVRDYLKLRIADREHEVFVALFLDSQNRLIAAEELFRGTLAQTSVYPREVVKSALKHNAAAVIFAHNHPSGVAEPSRADELLTQALKQALSLVDIRTLDHFVVGGTNITSFAERGLL